MLLKKCIKIDTYHCFTDINVFFKYRFFLRTIGKKILENSEKVICISQPYEKKLFSYIKDETFKAYIQNKTITLPNGIDDFWLDNICKNKKKESGKVITFICVANIEKNKNQLIACKAIQKFEGDGYAVKFILLGAILDKRYFECVSEYHFVEYKGNLEKTLLIDELRKSDIFIMPSHHETFGLVYAEALSQGLPVIYTKDEGFYGQFGEGEVGYGVSPDCVDEIYLSINKTLTNYERISKNCISQCEKYRWNEIEKQYGKIYEEIRRH